MKIISGVLPIISIFLPLWYISFNAPMFGQQWLDIYVYGNGHIDGPLHQINIANHYVGLKDITLEQLWELKYLPYLFLAIAAVPLISLVKESWIWIAAHLGLVLSIPVYIQVWLYNFGHDLQAGAAIEIEPFTPYVFGYYQIANFKILAVLHVGFWLLVASFILSFVAYWRFYKAE